jgi:hypothetical protein
MSGRQKNLRPLILTLALALAGLGGCASPKTTYDEYQTMPMEPAPEMMAEESVGMDVVSPESVSVDRSQIITGDLYLTVDSPSESADEVQTIVEEAGGRVDSRSEYVDVENQSPSAYLWVRIPVDVLPETLESIEALGDVESKSLNNSDVTLQVVDLDARIAVLTESITRLQALLAEATTTAELVEIETALSQRQAELDSLNSQRNYLADQVQFASIGIDLRSPDVAPERDPGSFLDGIIAGWQGLVSFALGTVVALGYALPWLGVAGIITLVIIVLVRWRKRGSKSE